MTRGEIIDRIEKLQDQLQDLADEIAEFVDTSTIPGNNPFPTYRGWQCHYCGQWIYEWQIHNCVGQYPTWTITCKSTVDKL
jgi:hypothetical protein